ncbi:MAG: DUF3450 family protein [Opitutales bacterium]|jgi:hypothetical protein
MKKLISAGIALGLFGTATLLQAQQSSTPVDAGEQIKAATEVTSKWVETRSTISKDANQWRVDKELIQQKIDFYRIELENLQTEIDTLSKSASEGQDKRAQYANQIEELNRAQSVVIGMLPKYEAQVRELVRYFPSPLQETAGKLAKSIPTNPNTTRLGAGQRLAVIVGILNEVDRFNRDVTTTQEIREINGENRQVDVMYMGLGQAFYADSEGKIAGIGTPAKDGWKWEAHDDMATQILTAIKVAQGKIKPAVFVEIPLQTTTINAISR